MIIVSPVSLFTSFNLVYISLLNFALMSGNCRIQGCLVCRINCILFCFLVLQNVTANKMFQLSLWPKAMSCIFTLRHKVERKRIHHWTEDLKESIWLIQGVLRLSGNIFVIQFCSACSDQTRVNTSTRIHDVVNFPTLETGNYMHRTRDRYQLVSITIHCAIEDSLPIP